MLTALIWILTPILIIDCLLLGLLVLIQLPKKEAGVGMAFGGGATDALFGAGSGTALTKLTKYTAGIFFALVLLLSILNVRANHSSTKETISNIGNPANQLPALPPEPVAPAPVPTNGGALLPPAPASTSAEVAPLTLPSVPPSNAPAPTGSATNGSAK